MEPELSGTLPQKSRFPGSPGTELDLRPEYCHYRDEGCELAESCLNCPLPKCIYDQPRGRQRWLKSLRDREIVRLANSEGKGIKELALRFGVSQRTVQRILKNYLSTLSPVSPSPSKGKGRDIKKRGEAPSIYPERGGV